MKLWLIALTMILSALCTPSMAAGPRLHLATLEYPPYITNTANGPQGLAVDIINTAFSRMAQSITIDFYPIARGQQKLLDGEVDAYFSIKKTAEREQSMLFTQNALMSQDYLFFVRKDSHMHFDGDFSSIGDATIGIVRATSYGNRFDSAVQAGVFTKLDETVSHETNFRKLLAHRIDMVICSRLVGYYYLKLLNGSDEVETVGPPIETTLSYLVFSRKLDHTVTSRKFDQALAAMERDGTLERLKKPYLYLYPPDRADEKK